MAKGFKEYGNPDYDYSFYNEKLEKKIEESSEIGFNNQNKEAMLNTYTVLLMMELKTNSPMSTGNLRNRGIYSTISGKKTRDIRIVAPGYVYTRGPHKGKKGPDYGWETENNSTLAFYNQRYKFIICRNKNQGWVEDSVVHANQGFCSLTGATVDDYLEGVKIW